MGRAEIDIDIHGLNSGQIEYSQRFTDLLELPPLPTSTYINRQTEGLAIDSHFSPPLVITGILRVIAFWYHAG